MQINMIAFECELGNKTVYSQARDPRFKIRFSQHFYPLAGHFMLSAECLQSLRED